VLLVLLCAVETKLALPLYFSFDSSWGVAHLFQVCGRQHLLEFRCLFYAASEVAANPELLV
jgi:hypothetical protein